MLKARKAGPPAGGAPRPPRPAETQALPAVVAPPTGPPSTGSSGSHSARAAAGGAARQALELAAAQATALLSGAGGFVLPPQPTSPPSVAAALGARVRRFDVACSCRARCVAQLRRERPAAQLGARSPDACLPQAAALPPDAAATELARLRALLLRLAAASDALRWADLAGAPRLRVPRPDNPSEPARFCRLSDAPRACSPPCADALLPPPTAPRGCAASAFALGVLASAAERAAADTAGAPTAGARAAGGLRPTHAAALLDALAAPAGSSGPRGEQCAKDAAACARFLTELSGAALAALLDTALPRLEAEAAAGGSGPLLRAVCGWRWRLGGADSDSAAGAAATARFLAALAARLLPPLKRGAAQRPASAAIAMLGAALRAASAAAPAAWPLAPGTAQAAPQPRGGAAAADAAAAAAGDVYTLLKAWSKKKNVLGEACQAMANIMAAAPPALWASPRRSKLFATLVSALGGEARAGGLAGAEALLRRVPAAAASAAGPAWSADVAGLLAAALAPPRKPVAGGSPKAERAALSSLLAAAARTAPQAALSAIEQQLAMPSLSPRVVALAALAALLAPPPAAAMLLPDDVASLRAADGALWQRAATLTPAVRAALEADVAPAGGADLPEACGADAAEAALGCIPLLLQARSSGGGMATGGSFRIAASAGAERCAAAVAALACGRDACCAATARAALRAHLPRLPTASLLAALRGALRVASRRAQSGEVPAALRDAAAGGAAWADSLAHLAAVLSECAGRCSAAPGAAAQAAAGGSLGGGSPSGGASAGGANSTLPGGAAWAALRCRAEGLALLALGHPFPAAWPAARRVAAAAALPSLRELECPGVGARLSGRLSAAGVRGAPLPPPPEAPRPYLADALEAAAREAASESAYASLRSSATPSLSPPPTASASASAMGLWAPEMDALLRRGAAPAAAMGWAWRKLSKSAPWARTPPPPGAPQLQAALWAAQARLLAAPLRLASAAGDAGAALAQLNLGGALNSVPELASAEAAAWLARARMPPAAAREALAGLMQALLNASAATASAPGPPPAAAAVLDAFAALHPSCHELLLQEAVRACAASSSPAVAAATRMRVLAAMAAGLADSAAFVAAPPAVRAALDDAVTAWGDASATAEDSREGSALDSATVAVVEHRLRLALPSSGSSGAASGSAASVSVPGDAALTAALPLPLRRALLRRLAALRAPACAALAALLRGGPVDDPEGVSLALAALERALGGAGEADADAAAAVAAALRHARWAAPQVCRAAVAPGGGPAAPRLWAAVCDAVCADAAAWAAHTVVVLAASPAGGLASSALAQSGVTCAPVPVGALVASALLTLTRAPASPRRDALRLLAALVAAFPPAFPDDAAPLARLPPPTAALPSGGAPAAAAARAAEAVQVSHALAAAFPHWAPSVAAALVLLAAACCRPPPAPRPGLDLTPPALMLALAAPWAAALPRLLARLAGPDAAAAAFAAAADAAAPPPLHMELTPRTMHLDRFLGDSLQAVDAAQLGAAGGPTSSGPGSARKSIAATAAANAAAAAASAAAAATAVADPDDEDGASPAGAAVAAVAGAALALGDLLPLRDGARGALLGPLWGGMLGGTPLPQPAHGRSPSAGALAELRSLSAAGAGGAALAAFLLDAHAAGGAVGIAPERPAPLSGDAAEADESEDDWSDAARIEAAVPMLLDAPHSGRLLAEWAAAVRSHADWRDEDGTAPYETPYAAQRGSVDRGSGIAEHEARERSALRLLAVAAALPRGGALLAPHAPRLLHACLALGAPLRLPWLLLRAAQLAPAAVLGAPPPRRGGGTAPPAGTPAAMAAAAAGAATLLAASELRAARADAPLWASPEAVPLLRALGAALGAWRPGMRRAWRREALGWLAANPSRRGRLVSLRVAAALARAAAAPPELVRLARSLAAAAAAGDADAAAAALAALPAAAGVPGASAAPENAHHFAAAAALATLAYPSPRLVAAALPLAERLLVDAGRRGTAAVSPAASAAAAAAAAASAAMPPRMSLPGATTPPFALPLLAGCQALSRFWFALPGVSCDAAAATMLLRAATLPGCAPVALRMLDALAVAQADTLPADNRLLLLALLAAAIEAQIDPAGPAGRARRAVLLVDACGFALDDVAAAFRNLAASAGAPGGGPMAPGPARAFCDALAGALALACPAPGLWAFGARAAARLAAEGPSAWRAAALRTAASLLAARARVWPADVLCDVATAAQRAVATAAAEAAAAGAVSPPAAVAQQADALAAALLDSAAAAPGGDVTAPLAMALATAAGALAVPDEAPAPRASETFLARAEGDAWPPCAPAAESVQLSGYAAAWMRNYVLPGLAALPGASDPADGADDSSLFLPDDPPVDPAAAAAAAAAQARAAAQAAAEALVAADVIMDGGSNAGSASGGRDSSPGGPGAAGAAWRVWTAWPAGGPPSPLLPSRPAPAPPGFGRATRGSGHGDGVLEAWVAPEEGAGGEASRRTLGTDYSSADWHDLPRSASAASTAAAERHSLSTYTPPRPPLGAAAAYAEEDEDGERFQVFRVD